MDDDFLITHSNEIEPKYHQPKSRNHIQANMADNNLYLKSATGEILLRTEIESDLRRKVLSSLGVQGFEVDKANLIVASLESDKQRIRGLHSATRDERLVTNSKFLARKENKMLQFFADGIEIDSKDFYPRVEVVETDTISADIFRYASLLWSVPVSSGFGRRTRFLVWDDSNKKLVGIFAIGDPVFNLTCRDAWIGWNLDSKMERLYNVMDVFVLGSVPPYNQVLGGKLVGMIAASNEVRDIIFRKYLGNRTIIDKKIKNPHLALLTTSSALGKSSIYDRIKYKEDLLYERIGETLGFGHFHLNNGLFEELRSYLSMISPELSNAYGFGQGPNYRMRVARKSLQNLGLPGDLLKHGIKREVYAIQLGSNCREFLKGNDHELIEKNMPLDEIAEFWKSRWLYDRIIRKPEYLKHNHEDLPAIIRSMCSKTS